MAVETTGVSGPGTRAASGAVVVDTALPWVCAVIVAGLTGAGIVLAALDAVSLGAALRDFYVATTACGLSFGVLSFLVARNRPGQPAGRLYCAVACATALSGFVAQYARYVLVTHPSAIPFGRPAAWLADWTWPIGYALLLVGVPVLFSDGRPLSRRWRSVGWVATLAVGLSMVGNALLPAANPDLPEVPNPYGVARLARLADALCGVGTPAAPVGDDRRDMVTDRAVPPWRHPAAVPGAVVGIGRGDAPACLNALVRCSLRVRLVRPASDGPGGPGLVRRAPVPAGTTRPGPPRRTPRRLPAW